MTNQQEDNQQEVGAVSYMLQRVVSGGGGRKGWPAETSGSKLLAHRFMHKATSKYILIKERWLSKSW